MVMLHVWPDWSGLFWKLQLQFCNEDSAGLVKVTRFNIIRMDIQIHILVRMWDYLVCKACKCDKQSQIFWCSALCCQSSFCVQVGLNIKDFVCFEKVFNLVGYCIGLWVDNYFVIHILSKTNKKSFKLKFFVIRFEYETVEMKFFLKIPNLQT